MKMMKIYVSGPFQDKNPEPCLSNLSLKVRRVALYGHLPLSGVLFYWTFFDDPRFQGKRWFNRLVAPLIKMADIFCYSPYHPRTMGRFMQVELDVAAKERVLMLSFSEVEEALRKGWIGAEA